MVNVEKILRNYGIDRARKLILEEGYTNTQFHLETGLSTAKGRTSQRIYQEAYKLLGIEDIPYKEDSQPNRKFKLEFDKFNGRYWESDYISEILLERLMKPTINHSEGSTRFVISFPKHPKSDPTSNQIKAHIVQWELLNEQYVPNNCWVIPIDDNYTNLDSNNWILVDITEYKSEKFSGTGNPSYKHGHAGRAKLGGWTVISRNTINDHPYCSKCNNKLGLVTHHIINYLLFNEPKMAHVIDNLMVLCQSCHASIHLNNINIKALIEETQYSKLLKLLETLKSQVPDSLMETYKDVEKQLGLTDNQQPSTVYKGEGSTTIQ